MVRVGDEALELPEAEFEVELEDATKRFGKSKGMLRQIVKAPPARSSRPFRPPAHRTMHAATPRSVSSYVHGNKPASMAIRNAAATNAKRHRMVRISRRDPHAPFRDVRAR
jgi:hypothetical protein